MTILFRDHLLSTNERTVAGRIRRLCWPLSISYFETVRLRSATSYEQTYVAIKSTEIYADVRSSSLHGTGQGQQRLHSIDLKTFEILLFWLDRSKLLAWRLWLLFGKVVFDLVFRKKLLKALVGQYQYPTDEPLCRLQKKTNETSFRFLSINSDSVVLSF